MSPATQPAHPALFSCGCAADATSPMPSRSRPISPLCNHHFQNFTYCAESFLMVAARSEEGSGAAGGLLMKTIAE